MHPSNVYQSIKKVAKVALVIMRSWNRPQNWERHLEVLQISVCTGSLTLKCCCVWVSHQLDAFPWPYDIQTPLYQNPFCWSKSIFLIAVFWVNVTPVGVRFVNVWEHSAEASQEFSAEGLHVSLCCSPSDGLRPYVGEDDSSKHQKL